MIFLILISKSEKEKKNSQYVPFLQYHLLYIISLYFILINSIFIIYFLKKNC